MNIITHVVIEIHQTRRINNEIKTAIYDLLKVGCGDHIKIFRYSIQKQISHTSTH
jgi:hypothetical protein